MIENIKVKNRLSWFGHIMRREETNIARKVISMKIDGYTGKGRP